VFRVKTRLRDLFRRQIALGSQSQEVLSQLTEIRAEIHELRAETRELREAVHALGARVDSFPSPEELRDIARLKARPYAYLGDHVGIATTAEGFRLLIDTRDRQIAPHLATLGTWEPWNTALVRAILKPGDSFVDVGSNVGFFVLLGRICVGQAGRVIAFEAHPELAELLAASVEINGFEPNVDVRHLAVSDMIGELEFAGYENYLGGGHILFPHLPRKPKHKTFRVPCDTLDNQLSELSDVRLLHMDAKGSEASILRGARGLIARSPRLVILMEWGLGTGDAAEAGVLEMLAEQGFSFYTVEHEGTLRQTSVEALAHSALCDVLCCRGEPDEFAVCESDR